ncbi:MAG: hypothetical protein QOG88_930, partial [Actinomycetota bacterium]|nr:hypothetical protein [Actinomycetota bacterium]
TQVTVRDRSAAELFSEIQPMAFPDALRRANAES